MKFLERYSFKAKILMLCIFLSSISLIVGGVSYEGLTRVVERFDTVTNDDLPNLLSLSEMRIQYREARVNLLSLALPGLSKEQGEHYIAKLGSAIEVYEKSNKDFLAVDFSSNEERTMWEGVNAEWTTFKAVTDRAVKHFRAGTEEDRARLREIYLEECPKIAEQFQVEISKLRDFEKAHAKASVDKAESSATTTKQMSVLFVVVGVLAGVVLGLMFANWMSRAMRQIAESLRANAEQVTAASTQIASASEELSQATTEQAASLEETAASVEELNSMVARNSENANSAAAASGTMQKKSNDGKGMVERMAHSMEAISRSNQAIMEQVNQSNESMVGIIKVIEQIDKKTKVINEIVNKTELLSFNASVEAARAGEHGKGFAVVAEEVGNLARMSGAAAEEIASLLEKSIDDVNRIVNDTKSKVERLIDEGRETVESGTQVVRQCADVFEDVVQNVSGVSGMAGEIASASQEQSRGCGEITKAMGQLDQMTQQNAATSEECASAAEALASQAEALKQAVDLLEWAVNGEGGHSRPFAAPSVASSAKSVAAERSKVVPLKPAPRLASASAPVVGFKKAVGDVPAYDSDGFKET